MAGNALESVRRLVRLQHLADHALMPRHEVSVVVLDVDRFKRVDDRLGYEDDVAARLGGEEFALVLQETDQRGALRVVERIRRRIRERATEVP